MNRPIHRAAYGPALAVRRVVRRIASYVEKQTLERILGYLARGRPLAGLPAESLTAHWIDADKTDNEHREAELLDLQCELDLRGIRSPSPD